MVLRILVTALACYFLGNHNGAISVSLMLGDDVRNHGSGNAGLTNFIRNYGGKQAFLVIAIDVCKAVLACLLGGLMFPEHAIAGRVLGGLCVMLGHDFPVLQGFRGGKGILSGWFIAICIDWRIGLAIAVVFFAVYFLTHYVSLGSVLASLTFSFSFALLHHDDLPVMLGGIIMGLLAVFMHRSNIRRLIKGQESKTNLFRSGSKK